MEVQVFSKLNVLIEIPTAIHMLLSLNWIFTLWESCFPTHTGWMSEFRVWEKVGRQGYETLSFEKVAGPVVTQSLIFHLYYFRHCCYILHSGNTVFTWSGNLTSHGNQELVERQLDIIKPNSQSKTQKEGAEFEQF